MIQKRTSQSLSPPHDSGIHPEKRRTKAGGDKGATAPRQEVISRIGKLSY